MFSKYIGKSDIQIYDEYKVDFHVDFDKDKIFAQCDIKLYGRVYKFLVLAINVLKKYMELFNKKWGENYE